MPPYEVFPTAMYRIRKTLKRFKKEEPTRGKISINNFKKLRIMPNHVTNRLEINADQETVQKVMNFLKVKQMMTIRLVTSTSTTLFLCLKNC